MVIKQESREQLPSDPASALQGMSTTLYSMLPCLSRCLPNQNSASARPKIKKLDQMFILQRTVYITFLLCVATKSMSSSVIGFFLFELSKLQSHTQNMIVPIFVLGAQNVWRGTGWIAMTCKPSNRVNDKVIFENICFFFFVRLQIVKVLKAFGHHKTPTYTSLHYSTSLFFKCVAYRSDMIVDVLTTIISPRVVSWIFLELSCPEMKKIEHV